MFSKIINDEERRALRKLADSQSKVEQLLKQENLAKPDFSMMHLTFWNQLEKHLKIQVKNYLKNIRVQQNLLRMVMRNFPELHLE